jgi:hypothetical protein
MSLNDVRSVRLPYCLDRQPDGRYASQGPANAALAKAQEMRKA